MLTTTWQRKAEEIARKYPEEDTSGIAQMVLEECYEGPDEPEPRDVDQAYHEIRHWLITYMACNPDT